MAALQPLIEAGRGRGGVELAPATLAGVRRLLKALRRGNTVGILPDQAPSEGEGAWADFFGRPAYTMTLVGRLVEATGATVIMAIAERLPHAQGYAIRLARPDGPLDGPEGMRNLNAAVEKMIALRPGQYLWGYNRYKVPSGVAPPPTDGRGT
jgi:KDO2-lipid IV(A) lauroyltransferase